MTDPKDCLYCQNRELLDSLMIKIADLSVSTLYLFKEQTYRGRCVVSYKDHINDLCDLSAEDLNALMADVVTTSKAMQRAFNPDKVNYGAYSDTLSHVHFHLVPKYQGGADFGSTFVMNPKEVYLSDAEYAELIEAVRGNL